MICKTRRDWYCLEGSRKISIRDIIEIGSQRTSRNFLGHCGSILQWFLSLQLHLLDVLPNLGRYILQPRELNLTEGYVWFELGIGAPSPLPCGLCLVHLHSPFFPWVETWFFRLALSMCSYLRNWTPALTEGNLSRPSQHAGRWGWLEELLI